MNTAPPAQRSPGPLRPWLLVALLLAAATVCGLLLDSYLSLISQAMVYVLAVVIASYRLDWVESAVCAVGAVTAMNFFFVPPRWTFEVENQEHFVALVVMLVVALVISRLASGLRRESETARRNEQRARQLQGLATDLSAVSSAQEIGMLGQSALNAAFSGPCTLVLADASGEPFPTDGLDAQLRDGLRCCMVEAAVLGPGTGRWPGLEAWYLPLGDKGRVSGAACVRPAPAADTGAREHAQALCALLAQALWRLHLTASVQAAQSEARHQQLQSTFLAAVSHDLRTPLAAIVGAASALQTQGDKLGAAEQARLLESIVSEATYLSDVSENTLQLVRLAGTAQPLRRDWESMEEIVGAVLARVRARDPARRIQSRVPKDLPLVKADPVLLAQLIANLLDNALKYSEGAIDLSVACDGGTLVLAVKDRGSGISQAEQARLFEPYVRGDHSTQRGVGLGLALCRAIAQAHGGELSYRARAGGGSSFTLRLPIEAQQLAQESL